jgi:hypothetical protein
MSAVLATKDSEGLPESRGLLLPTITATLLCSVFTACCESSRSALAGTFGGVLIVTITLPPLVLTLDNWLRRVLVSLAGVSAVMAAWLFLPIDWSQWGSCAALLATYAVALTGAAALLRWLGVNAFASAAIVVVVALAWLSWPVWLSPLLAGHESFVNWLVFAHPLLAVNGVLIDQGIWTERPRMYGWTALNQDVSYSMPASMWWCFFWHGVLGVAFLALSTWQKKDENTN